MDLLTPHALGLFLGRAAGMALPGLFVAFLYPVMSTCRLRTGIMVGVAATIIAGAGLGWFLASGEAYNLMARLNDV